MGTRILASSGTVPALIAASTGMKRLRLRVSKDPGLVLAQGTTKRSYKPFAQAFGAGKRGSDNAALIVKAVNCNTHMTKALHAVLRMSRLPVNGDWRTRLSLIERYASTALSQVEK
jgi:hypothetical protein